MIRYEVVRVTETKQTTLVTYHEKKDADDLSKRLNEKKNIYVVKQVEYLEK